jgi:dolichol-phosphate mannosyltransferase
MMRRGGISKQQQLSQSSNASLIFSAWVGNTSSSQAQIILIDRQEPAFQFDPSPGAELDQTALTIGRAHLETLPTMIEPTSPEEAKRDGILLSVVVPCFNEEASLPELFAILLPTLEAATTGSWELILVDDGSEDRTGELIWRKHLEENRVGGVILSRNFGHQAALVAGLTYASGCFVGIMDADLQDPPEILIQCFQKTRDGEYDLVYGVREHRKSSPLLKAAYWMFYRLMRALAEYSWPLDAGDFSVFNRRALHLLMQLPERVRVLRGLRSWIGLKQGIVAYDRPGRDKGESKYSFAKLIDLAINALVSFSSLPLRLASLVGLTMSGLTFLLGVLLLINRFYPKFTLFGYYIGQSPGTTTIVTLLLVIGSLLFLCLGILGEYLGLLLKEVKRRPVAIVRERVGLKRASAKEDLVLEALEPAGRKSIHP